MVGQDVVDGGCLGWWHLWLATVFGIGICAKLSSPCISNHKFIYDTSYVPIAVITNNNFPRQMSVHLWW